MYIAYKNSDKKVISIRETEEQCRMNSKGMDRDAFNVWKESLRGEDGKVTYPSEDFTIIRSELSLKSPVSEDEGALLYKDYISKPHYHLKWNTTKKELEPNDASLTAQNLADEWVRIRKERDRLIAETDWMMLSDTGTVSTAWKNYRKALREIPQSQDSVKKFSDIDWPVKPS